MAKKAKKVEAPKDELVLWVLWSETETGGEVCEGQEGDQWASHEPSYIDAHFKGVYVGEVPPGGFRWSEKSESFTVPKTAFEAEVRTQVYAVIARYSDGSTFGSSHGHVYVGGVYGSYERAAERVKELKACGKGDYSVPWTGYFNSLESLEVEALHILNGAGSSPGKRLPDGTLADW